MIDLFTKIAERIRLSAAELKFRFRELIGRLTGRSARANDYGKGIFYIRGSDVLPPPLSPEEERKLTQRLTEQDSEARSTLIEHNLRLVAHVIKKDYCKRLIRPVENGLKPAAPVSDRSLNGFACHCFAPAPQYDPESLPQLQSESRL